MLVHERAPVEGLGQWGAIIGAVAGVAAAGLQVYSAQRQIKAQESAAKKDRALQLAMQAQELKVLADAQMAQQNALPSLPVPQLPYNVQQALVTSTAQAPVQYAVTQDGRTIPIQTLPSQQSDLTIPLVIGGAVVIGLGAILLLRS